MVPYCSGVACATSCRPIATGLLSTIDTRVYAFEIKLYGQKTRKHENTKPTCDVTKYVRMDSRIFKSQNYGSRVHIF